MKTICIYNNKGGVGKTTTTKFFAKFLAKQNKNVLLIDLDPQANLSSQFVSQPIENTVVELLTSNVSLNECISKTEFNMDIVKSDLRLQKVNNTLLLESMQKSPVERLKKKLQNINYDYVLIDCPPTMDLLVSNALAVADEVIIPIKADLYSIDGIELLINNIEEIKTEFNPDLKIASIFLNQHKKTNVHKQIYENCQSHLNSFSDIYIGDYTVVSSDTIQDTKIDNHKVSDQFNSLFETIVKVEE